ncbi:MAG: GMC family oxidoreductase [Acidobacteriaceae bacterium]|nr:GMC family oxidoreductase [Acidobacteriaceae bacterium]
MFIQKPGSVYDAVIVGSGATGGWAAKLLSEAGMQVALVEAGRRIDPSEFTEHKPAWQLPYLGHSPLVSETRPIQSTCPSCTEYNYKWFVDDHENPYTQEKPFTWIRMRVLGGRTLSWGRQVYRMSDLDFKAASHDGYGENWPISYADLAPYYDTVESYIGVSGQREGLPQLPDGPFLPPMEFTCGEKVFKKEVERQFGRRVTIGRAAILTKPHNGRPACHYCGPCYRGCITRSYFNSPATTLADAEKTGRLTIITEAVAARILMKDGKAAGVAYIDANRRTLNEVRGKLVVLCASSLESVRLMLNSGICNSSGALGHYILDNMFRGGADGFIPAGEARPWSGAPARPNGIYIPRFRNVTEKETNGFIRGYGYQGGCTPSFDFGAPGLGAQYKDAVRSGHWGMRLNLYTECLARKENRVEIDRSRTDAWGVPILKMNMSWSDNELRMFADGQQEAMAMLKAAGAENIRLYDERSKPGAAIHESGGARMGDDRRTSVLNRYNQAHDVENLFVTDGSCFVTNGCQNPTLTMMAITVRACDYITNEYAKKLV